MATRIRPEFRSCTDRFSATIPRTGKDQKGRVVAMCRALRAEGLDLDALDELARRVRAERVRNGGR
jgi:hypothetical protein